MNGRAHFVLAVAALGLLLPADGSPQAKPVPAPSPTAKQALDEAGDLAQKGEFTKAEPLARKAVALAPNSAVAHNLLGFIEEQLKRPAEAEAAYRRALRLNPGLSAAHGNLGNLLLQQGKLEPARKELLQALKADPKNARAHFNLALLHVREKEYAAAAEHFAAVRQLRGDDPSLILMYIGAALKAEQTQLALKAADDLARSNAQDPRVLFNLALVLAQEEQYEKASELFSRVNELRPQTPEVLYNLGIAYHNLKRLDDAAGALAEAADIKPDLSEAHFRLGLIASERRDHDNAILEFQHAVKFAPERAQYHYLLGREQFAVGRWELAARSYGKAAELDSKQPLYALSLGNALYRAENYAGAAAAFETVARLDPKTEDIQYLIGYCYRVQGLLDRALVPLRGQLDSNPQHAQALASVGFILLEQGDLAGAQAQLENLVSLAPDDVDGWFDLARTYNRQKQSEKAIQAFLRVLSLSPDNIQAHYQLFLLYTRNKHPDQAKDQLAQFQRLEEMDKIARREETAISKERRAQAEEQPTGKSAGPPSGENR